MARPYSHNHEIWVGFIDSEMSSPTTQEPDPGNSQIFNDTPENQFRSPIPSTPLSGDVQFLGTCEVTPIIQLVNKYGEIKTCNLGEEVSDSAFQAESALVVAPLNRYNDLVYQRISTKALTSISKSLLGIGAITQPMHGSWKAEDVGRLAIRESFATHFLYVRFPQAGRPYGDPITLLGIQIPAVDTTFPVGYRFHRARLDEPDTIDRMGPTPRLLTLSWICLPWRWGGSEGGSNQVARGDWVCYDHDLSILTNLNPGTNPPLGK